MHHNTLGNLYGTTCIFTLLIDTVVFNRWINFLMIKFVHVHNKNLHRDIKLLLLYIKLMKN